jgi:hypothetical protein
MPPWFYLFNQKLDIHFLMFFQDIFDRFSFETLCFSLLSESILNTPQRYCIAEISAYRRQRALKVYLINLANSSLFGQALATLSSRKIFPIQ